MVRIYVVGRRNANEKEAGVGEVLRRAAILYSTICNIRAMRTLIEECQVTSVRTLLAKYEEESKIKMKVFGGALILILL